MKIIYVAGPYSAGNVIDVLKNIGRGQKVCAELFQRGFAPFCPWHDKSFITDNPEAVFNVEQFYEYSMEFLRRSDAVLLIPGWKDSKGTLSEIKTAESFGIPVFTNDQDLIEWSMSKR